MSIGKRLAISFFLTVIGSIFITAIISNHRIDQEFNKYLLENHHKKMDRVKNLVVELYSSKEKRILNDDEIQRYALMEDLFIEIKDIDENIVFSSGQNHLIHQRMMGSMMERMMNKSIDQEEEYREEVFSLYKNERKIGTITIGYFGKWNATKQDIGFKNTLNHSFLISVTGALVFGLIISLILTKGLTVPLREITKVANEMRNGNLEIRSKGTSSIVEIDHLSKSINYLAETLQQQEMLRKRLSSDMAHEIRTPLTTLQTHVEAMIDGIWEPKKERLQGCYEEILRLRKMVDNLKDLAKLEQANLDLNKSKFNISNTIEKIIESFQVQYKNKDLKITSDLVSPIEVLMDQDKLKQIMVNLLSNAYKYSKVGGNVKVTLRIEKENIFIFVKDEGIGIPTKDIPHIFERFYRGDLSRGRETGGTGIGLAIVKTLVEAHGGKIDVESEEGKGSQFIIKFPKEILM